MISAVLKNENDYIEIRKVSTIDDSIEIEIIAKSSFIQIDFSTYIFISSLKEFCKKITETQEKLSGKIVDHYFNYEEDFKIDIEYFTGGHAVVNAFFKSLTEFGNKCYLSFATDQTFINKFLIELKQMINS